MNITLRAHPGSTRMQRVAAVQWMENLICNTGNEDILTIDVPRFPDDETLAFSTITQTGGGKRMDLYVFRHDGPIVLLHQLETDGDDDLELELYNRSIPGYEDPGH